MALIDLIKIGVLVYRLTQAETNRERLAAGYFLAREIARRAERRRKTAVRRAIRDSRLNKHLNLTRRQIEQVLLNLQLHSIDQLSVLNKSCSNVNEESAGEFATMHDLELPALVVGFVRQSKQFVITRYTAESKRPLRMQSMLSMERGSSEVVDL